MFRGWNPLPLRSHGIPRNSSTLPGPSFVPSSHIPLWYGMCIDYCLMRLQCTCFWWHDMGGRAGSDHMSHGSRENLYRLCWKERERQPPRGSLARIDYFKLQRCTSAQQYCTRYTASALQLVRGLASVSITSPLKSLIVQRSRPLSHPIVFPHPCPCPCLLGRQGERPKRVFAHYVLGRLAFLFFLCHPGTLATFSDGQAYLLNRYPNRDLVTLECQLVSLARRSSLTGERHGASGSNLCRHVLR